MAAITTFLLDQNYYKVMVRQIKTALAGLETFTDAQATTYLNTRWNSFGVLGLANPLTVEMVHEARIAKI